MAWPLGVALEFLDFEKEDDRLSHRIYFAQSPDL
jgi:hypothetical protein